MAVSVVTRGTDAPVEAAALAVDGTTVLTDADGVATLTALRGATVSASAEGHDAAEGAVPDEGDLVLDLRQNVVSGTVTNTGGEPVAGVRVFVDGFSAQYLTGVTIDYVSSMQGSGFTFSNPNATGGCGCGSSFTA